MQKESRDKGIMKKNISYVAFGVVLFILIFLFFNLFFSEYNLIGKVIGKEVDLQNNDNLISSSDLIIRLLKEKSNYRIRNDIEADDLIFSGDTETKGFIVILNQESVIESKLNLEKTGIKFNKYLGESQRSLIRQEKTDFKNKLKQISSSVEITGEVDNVLNAVFISETGIGSKEIASLKNLPEVKDVLPNLIYTINLDGSVPLIEADQVWQLDESGEQCSVPLSPKSKTTGNNDFDTSQNQKIKEPSDKVRSRDEEVFRKSVRDVDSGKSLNKNQKEVSQRFYDSDPNKAIAIAIEESAGSCTNSQSADTDGDGVVGILDFLTVLTQWGPCDAGSSCTADVAPVPGGDGIVGIDDFLLILAYCGDNMSRWATTCSCADLICKNISIWSYSLQ